KKLQSIAKTGARPRRPRVPRARQDAVDSGNMIEAGRHRRTALVLLVVVGVAATAAAQRRRGGFGGFFVRAENPAYDGAFRFCRIMFRQSPHGDGNGWSVDYPR